MPCEHYKDALVEVAASGAAPQGELRAHLDKCSSCRGAFKEEQTLFAAINSGLHANANAEVPSSLLPRVRARLDESVVPRFQWARPLIFACATVAVALMIFLIARPRHELPENVAKQAPLVAPIRKAPQENVNPGKILPSGAQIASLRASHPRWGRNSTNVHSTASGSLEVLVPPDEREGLARLVATLNGHGDVAASLVAKVPEKKDEDGLAIVEPVRIPDIEIKPLGGTETETSDGRGEEH